MSLRQRVVLLCMWITLAGTGARVAFAQSGGTIGVTSPAEGAVWFVETDGYMVEWGVPPGSGPRVDIHLYKGTEERLHLSNTDNDGITNVRIPDSQPPGWDYRIKVTVEGSPAVYGFSGEFGLLHPRTPEMRLVPAGVFMMGNPYEEPTDSGADERPTNFVYVSSFLMSKYEITNKEMRDALQWAVERSNVFVAGETVFNREGDQRELLKLYPVEDGGDCAIEYDAVTRRFSVDQGRDEFPCINVTWYGAAAYCNYRSDMEGLERAFDFGDWSCDFAKTGYRLPTEAEWEKAARGRLTGHWLPWPSLDGHWSEYVGGSNANYAGSGDPWEDGARPKSTPVGFYDGTQPCGGPDTANGYGLYDMMGNMFEWCYDWYDASIYASRGTDIVDNPVGPASGTFRAMRGGSWRHDIEHSSRCSRRSHGTPSHAYDSYGFRVALTVEPRSVCMALTTSAYQLGPPPGYWPVPHAGSEWSTNFTIPDWAKKGVLTFDVSDFTSVWDHGQVLFNGHVVGPWPLTWDQGWQRAELEIPGNVLMPGENTICLRAPYPNGAYDCLIISNVVLCVDLIEPCPGGTVRGWTLQREPPQYLCEARQSPAPAVVGSTVFFGGGHASSGQSDIVDVYDVATGMWRVELLSSARGDIAGIGVGHRALFAGGIFADGTGDAGHSAVVDIYDTETDAWSQNQLSMGRELMGVAALDGYVWFAGGHGDGYNRTARVDIYDSAKRIWSTETLSQGREKPACAAVGSKIIVAGGRTDHYACTAVVDMFDIRSGSKEVCVLSQGRAMLASAAVGRKALFAGGMYRSGSQWVPSAAVDIYDAETEAWSTAQLSVPRGYISAATVGPLVLFAGGAWIEGDRYVVTRVVDVFDSRTGAWSTEELEVARSSMGSATVGKKVFFAGGSTGGTGGAYADVVEIFGFEWGCRPANEPPVASAGPDQEEEATGPDGREVGLNGSASYDPDGTNLTYRWSWAGGSAAGVAPVIMLPLGTNLVTLLVNDGQLDSEPDMVTIVVQDTTPPALNVPGDVLEEAEAQEGNEVPLAATATDLVDPDPTLTSDAPPLFALGTTVVTFVATDFCQNAASNDVTVIVQDTTPPVLSVPPDLTALATGLLTHVEIGAATATDIFDVIITNDAPADGYPLGETIVTWTATDTSMNSSTGTQSVMVVDDDPPVITITGVSEGEECSESATLVITVVDSGSGVATRSVTLDGVAFESGTEVSGLGAHTLAVSAADYAGNPASTNVLFWVLTEPSLAVEDASGVYSDDVQLRATLSARGAALAGKLVRFRVSGELVGSAETGADGVAVLDYVVGVPAAAYSVTATFDKDREAGLWAGTGTGTLTVEPETATVTYCGDHLKMHTERVRVAALVVQQDDGMPGDLTLARARFDFALVNPDGSLTDAGSFLVSCGSDGLAAFDADFGVGVYAVTVSIGPDGYFAAPPDAAMLVVYDPTDGHASGGGWIEVQDPAAGDLGRANFGFIAKYKADAAAGNLEFQYASGDINLKSSAIDWLVISAVSAQFEGVGTIKHWPGEYAFRVECTDNKQADKPDKITVRIWAGADKSGGLVYKALNQDLAGGNIVVKTK
ncbi:MAG: SUMF1/EgtB/PvdO family nonheme iron enzyme [Kiritimatiellae bacterium]|nr:SUMF1/EgtB/PvdO family nonheme iron enzyme [Kiritimatiellia bacterium]